MPNPLIFLAAIVVIDLILKSMKTKKNREHVKKTSMEQAENKVPTSPKTSRSKSIRELRMMLEEELGQEKGKKQEVEKNIDIIEKRKTRDDLIEDQRKKIDKHSELAKMKRKIKETEKENSKNDYRAPIKQMLKAKTHEDKGDFSKDIVKGIILSEILGKPKSMRK